MSDLSDLSDASDQSDARNLAEAKAVLECLLFATDEPLSLQQLRRAIRRISEKSLRALIVDLQSEYDSRGSGLQIIEVAGGWQMATRPRYAKWLESALGGHRRKRRVGLSAAMLETLAIIAYKQPIIRAEVEAIRGVDSSGTMHALLEIGLIEVVGQKPSPGRPFLYGTSKAFLKHFGLRSLADMPSIEALRQRFDRHPSPSPSPTGGGPG
ncbi:SMC-Scp complex subunit ScpB [Candidatus Sumerlaeota bacterium]|nr:SMC-Scp complex subunit ScpB [Candidatus Sumerlaeota bacterium]